MVEFAGWLMPVTFEGLGILREHEITRTAVGVFDICHMGEFDLQGPGAKALLQELMTNDLDLLEDGKGQYACMCYENGTVVDDCIYYQLAEGRYKIIVNASNRAKDFDWIQGHIGEHSVTFTDLSDARGRFAVQGPNAQSLLEGLCGPVIAALKRFYCVFTELGGVEVFVARTGYTGEDGFEISFPIGDTVKLYTVLLGAGAPLGVSPIGLGARDSLRLEACYSLYGHEINDTITPVEAGIGWAVKPKNVEYMGKKVLLAQKTEGAPRKLMGIRLLGGGILREHQNIFVGDECIGHTTSGGYGPTVKMAIGLALVQAKYAELGTAGGQLTVEIRQKRVSAEFVPTPFYKR
jgi:aminomethyltransferase